MNLTHHFEISTDLETAWAVLLDIPRITPCMPGAELVEILGEGTYKGLARVKIGPISLQFNGEAEIVEVDDADHRATVRARGSDGKGRGNADATVRFALTSEEAQKTLVQVETDLSLSGAVAQYGRASGLIDSVANQIIADFVKNLEAELATGRPETAAVKEAGVSTGGDAPSADAQKPRPANAPVSGLGLLFRAIVAMISGWFKTKDNSR